MFFAKHKKRIILTIYKKINISRDFNLNFEKIIFISHIKNKYIWLFRIMLDLNLINKNYLYKFVKWTFTIYRYMVDSSIILGQKSIDFL